MNSPLNRPMFANGGSVYIPPALRYMAQNPDVFNASVANARARGLSGQNMQGQIERDAALHYAFHGQGEGRQYGGRTFLGGLLEPRLGDTFGLSPERKKELEDERDAIANPPEAVEEPAEGLVGLVPIDDIEAGQGDGNFAKGGLISLADGGEVSKKAKNSEENTSFLDNLFKEYFGAEATGGLNVQARRDTVPMPTYDGEKITVKEFNKDEINFGLDMGLIKKINNNLIFDVSASFSGGAGRMMDNSFQGNIQAGPIESGLTYTPTSNSNFNVRAGVGYNPSNNDFRGGITGIYRFAEGGEVYETSPVVQGYLQSNTDVLDHSVRVAQSLGIPPGKDFQRAVENAAREHWNTFGKNEGRSISGYGDEGASLMTTDSERVIIRPQAENEGIFANPVNPHMLAIAELLKGTRNVYNEPEDLYTTAFFGTDPRGGYYEPEYQQTTRQIDDILGRIGSTYRAGIIGAKAGDSNEDTVAREMDNALRGLFVRRGHLGEIPSIYEDSGGTPELTRALGELGGYDIDPTGRISDNSYGQNMRYRTIGGRPISLADISEANILRNINSRFNSGSSRDPDETDDIGPGGSTFVRYDDTAQINPEAGTILPDGSMAPALIPGTGNPVEFQTGYGSLGEFFDQLPEMIEQFEPIGALNPGAGTISAGITASRGTDLNPAFGTNPFNQDQSMALSGTNVLTQIIDPLPNNMNQYGLGGFSGFAPFGDQSPQEGYTTLGEFDRSLVG